MGGGASNPAAVDLSVVIPVYNSAGCLRELVASLERTLTATGRSFELVLVDDASADASWPVICELAAAHPRLRALRLMVNGGQARATLCGLAEARGVLVATMDDDLQHRPDQLPVLLDKLARHPEADAVTGWFPAKHHAAYRNWGSRIITWINARAFHLPPDVRASGFRVLRRPLVEAVAAHRTANPCVTVLIYQCTRNLVSVPLEHAPRHAGRSNYTLARQFRLAFDTICNVTLLPLRLLSFLGIFICGLSFLFAAVVLFKYFTRQIGVPGWTTLSLITSFSAGLILFALGVLGEYLGRVLKEVRGAPPYIVRDRVGGPPAGA